MAEINKGQVNLNTVLGAIGTYGAVAGGNLLGGVIGGNGGCSDDHCVNRYEAAQAAKISELQSQLALRDTNTFVDQKLLEIYRYVDGKFGCVERELADQRVYNATANATISCIQGQIAQLMGLTKLVVPNASICPGYGEVTITPAATTTGA